MTSLQSHTIKSFISLFGEYCMREVAILGVGKRPFASSGINLFDSWP